jgi:hypothetical protein
MNGSFDIEEECKAVFFEIMNYKWLESEKAGYDIGSHRATHEWINRHYDDWFRFNVNRFIREE